MLKAGLLGVYRGAGGWVYFGLGGPVYGVPSGAADAAPVDVIDACASSQGDVLWDCAGARISVRTVVTLTGAEQHNTQ